MNGNAGGTAVKNKGRISKKILTYIFVALCATIAMFPIIWALSTSLKPESQVLQYPPKFIPETFTLENFQMVLFRSNYTVYLRNTILVTLIVMLVAVLMASHAAYAFSKLRFRGSDILMFIVLMTTMIPAIAEITPLYILFVRLGIYDTRFALVLVYVAWRAPIMTWLMKGFFDQIPSEISDAAMVDGASQAQIFYRIVLPLSKPGIASIALLSAVFVWNDYLVSSSFVSDESKRMLSTGIYTYVTSYGVYWGQLMAAVVIAMVPLIILFVCLQKQFVAGLTSGAVKG